MSGMALRALRRPLSPSAEGSSVELPVPQPREDLLILVHTQLRTRYRRLDIGCSSWSLAIVGGKPRRHWHAAIELFVVVVVPAVPPAVKGAFTTSVPSGGTVFQKAAPAQVQVARVESQLH